MHFQCWSFFRRSQKYGHVPSTRHHLVSCGQLSVFTSGIKQCIFRKVSFCVLPSYVLWHILSPENCAKFWHAYLEGVCDSWIHFSCGIYISAPPTIPTCTGPVVIVNFLWGSGCVACLCLLSHFLNCLPWASPGGGPTSSFFFLVGGNSVLWGVSCSFFLIAWLGFRLGCLSRIFIWSVFRSWYLSRLFVDNLPSRSLLLSLK